MWQERADYGHFFYRIPNGESAADAYDRVSGFNESLWRQFGDDDFPSVCVLGQYPPSFQTTLFPINANPLRLPVTHGLMSRVFLMKWYHFTVEYFEDLRNVNHCEFLLMRKQDNGKYLLKTKLRTWSELRRERAQVVKDKEKEKEKDNKDDLKLESAKSFVVTRRWGGCPNGCNHTVHYKKRHDLDALRQRDDEHSGGSTIATRRHRQHQIQVHSSDEEGNTTTKITTKTVEVNGSRTSDELVSSPDGTPSFITAEDRVRSFKNAHLHVGRDFGGSYSGHASLAGSDTDFSEDEQQRQRRIELLNAHRRNTGGTALANRLGDDSSGAGSDDGSGAEPELLEDLDKAEKEDRSILGSVY